MSEFTQTPNYALYKPAPNADTDQWGNHLNLNADALDSALHAATPASITMTANPTVLILAHLPTSNTGLAAGQVWNNAGVLCIA